MPSIKFVLVFNRILLPNKSSYRGDVCVKFAYHMYGFHVRRLELFVKSDGRKTRIWDHSGQIGNYWNRASVNVNLGKNAQVSFQIFHDTVINGTESELYTHNLDHKFLV